MLLFDANFQLVHKAILGNGINQLNLSGLDSGMYTAIIYYGEEVSVERVSVVKK